MADFFGKIKDGIGKGVTAASVKSKELLDSNKVKGQISSLEKQKKENIEELGSIVFTMFKKDGFDEFMIKEKCSLLIKVEEQVMQLEQELRDIHIKAEEALGNPRPIDTCSCGADIFENTKFCGKCGAKYGELKSQMNANKEKISCNQCNAVLDSDTKYCYSCGANCG